MSTAPLSFSCDCGAIEGTLSQAGKRGIHIVCFCDSCRAAALHAGDATEAGAPVGLYLTQPEHITLAKGVDNLRPMAFSPKGIVRWQAACCKGQIFSTQPDPKMAFMSLRTDKLKDPSGVGPVVSRVFVPAQGGKTRHEGKRGLIRLIMGSLRARLSGRWRLNPLYDPETREPVRAVNVLPKGERDALLWR
ncbi:MAG: DUF6151 family protein [Pseudomonadota bacterium]